MDIRLESYVHLNMVCLCVRSSSCARVQARFHGRLSNILYSSIAVNWMLIELFSILSNTLPNNRWAMFAYLCAFDFRASDIWRVCSGTIPAKWNEKWLNGEWAKSILTWAKHEIGSALPTHKKLFCLFFFLNFIWCWFGFGTLEFGTNFAIEISANRQLFSICSILQKY